MRKSIAGVVSAAVMAVPLVLNAGTGALAASSPVTFVGHLAAQETGTLTISPALTATPSAHRVRLTLRATFSGVTGSTLKHGVTITGGNYTLRAWWPAGTDCTNFAEATNHPRFTGTVDYTTTGGTAVPTTLTLGGRVQWVDVPPLDLTIGGMGSKATVTGSFATPRGPRSSDALVLDQSLNTAMLECSQHSLGSLSFSGNDGTSFLYLG